MNARTVPRVAGQDSARHQDETDWHNAQTILRLGHGTGGGACTLETSELPRLRISRERDDGRSCLWLVS